MKAINSDLVRPTISRTNKTLLNVYRQYMAMTRKDLQREFGLKRDQAYKIMRYVDTYCREHNITPYYVCGGAKFVRTTYLFRAYDWDIEQIKERLRI